MPEPLTSRGACLQRGDIIVRVNSVDVVDSITTTREVGSLAAGSRNRFVIYREGERMTINVTVGERPANLGRAVPGDSSPAPESSDGEEAPLGVSLKSLSNQDRETLDLDDDEKGMLITEIDRDSALYKAGVREGMAILDVNYKKLDSISILEEEVSKAEDSGRNRLLLAVHGEMGTRFVTVNLNEDE